MEFLRRVTLRTRFHLVLLTISISLLVLGGWDTVASRQAGNTLSQLFDQAHSAANQAGDLREAMSSLRRWEASMMAVGTSNANEVERLHALWKKELAGLQSTGKRLQQDHASDPQVLALLNTQQQLLTDYQTVIAPIAEQLQAAQIDGPVALAYAGKADDTLEKLQRNTGLLLQTLQSRITTIQAELADNARQASLLRLGLIGLTLLVFVPLMWLTLRSVCGPLDQATALAARIAQGDLANHVPTQGSDEPARLMQALAQMQQQLQLLVGEVQQSAQSIQVASSEVATGNMDLSNRTEQTASNLQQTAASMEQLTGTVKHSADAARQANQLAASAAEVASRGGSVVSQVVSTMDEITSSSRKIADIIGVIDGIAFQTNILALNAAVEAARAGEQGRGFAVVAGEVRNLAGRSAEAAREIKRLIGASVERVETGSRLVADAGQTMKEIVGSVQRVSDIIGEITAAASEQSDGIGQVNAAVTQLDQMTQQNAALVEQSAAAADSLQSQAQRLGQALGRFRLAEVPAPLS